MVKRRVVLLFIVLIQFCSFGITLHAGNKDRKSCELSLLGEAGELEEIKEAFTMRVADYGGSRASGKSQRALVSPTLVEASFLLRIKKNIESIMGDVSSAEEFRQTFYEMRRRILENDQLVLDEILDEGGELVDETEARLTDIDILEITHLARVYHRPLSWLIDDTREMQLAFSTTYYDENHYPTAERPWRKVARIPTPREALALIRMKREFESLTGHEFSSLDEFKQGYGAWKKNLN